MIVIVNKVGRYVRKLTQGVRKKLFVQNYTLHIQTSSIAWTVLKKFSTLRKLPSIKRILRELDKMPGKSKQSFAHKIVFILNISGPDKHATVIHETRGDCWF